MTANPAGGELNRDNGYFLISVRELGSAIASRVSPLILNAQGEFDAYLPYSKQTTIVSIRSFV